MKKIRLMLKSEDVQAGLFITGFLLAFALLFIFFYNN
jgi:hypothetical protein